jgi:hypothetical protein
LNFYGAGDRARGGVADSSRWVFVDPSVGARYDLEDGKVDWFMES